MSTPNPIDYEMAQEIAAEFVRAIDTNASDYGAAAQILRDYVESENAKLRAALDEARNDVSEIIATQPISKACTEDLVCLLRTINDAVGYAKP